MPSSLPDVTAQAIREEQDFLTVAESHRKHLIDALGAQLREPVKDRTDHHRRAMLAARVRALTEADTGLVLGRIDTDDEATHRIGRVGIPRPDGGEPLVLDWRADAARPFYTATAVDPQGLLRRRHIRTSGAQVTGVDDEFLADGAGSGVELVGEAALLASLDEGRTGHMGTAVATLQREQDAIVRASADAPLVVQGGPGTGKTVVALHRVAYLLFARPEIARRGVLLLGPSRRFLSYVEQVLPALGETAVVSTTCDELVPGVGIERGETREIAEIKGRALWWDALRRHVAELVPAATDLPLVLDGERYLVSGARLAGVLRGALAGDRSLRAARSLAFARLRDELVERVVERTAELLISVEHGLDDILGRVDASLAKSDDRGVRTAASSSQVDGELSEHDIEELRSRVEADAGVSAVLERWWPVPDPRRMLSELLHDPAALARVAPELTAEEIAAVVAEPTGLASSDIALLDALMALIGTETARQDDGEPFLADRAAADHGWTYGHVVIDEAQELSPMQWHMARRRTPTGSLTAVGDIDQAESPHRHTDWDGAVAPALGSRWRRSDLTICYRTPREVMALVPPILERAGSRSEPPRAVRSSGHEPRELTIEGPGLVSAVVTQVEMLSEAYPDGSVGVVTAVQHSAALRAALPGRPVMSALEAKGLEWDACVVVAPESIAAEPRGWNALYVATTRCTQQLVQVHVR